MQYNEIITRAFSISWRAKYLWILALLGGSDVGSSLFVGNNLSNFYGSPPYDHLHPYRLGSFLPFGMQSLNLHHLRFGQGSFWPILITFLIGLGIFTIL
ncbi:MAG: hypothetical protein ACREN8_08825, partial [Candidatus Dormibacteraceae bacterium]